MPPTLHNLRDMARHVQWGNLSDTWLWVAILVWYFGMFRKDKLTVGEEEPYNTRAALVRDDVLFSADGETVWIWVRYSKTI